MDIQTPTPQPEALPQAPNRLSWRKWALGALVVLIIVVASAWSSFRLPEAFALRAPAESVVGAEFRVVLEVTSPDVAVSAVETSFTYDAELLELVSVVPGDLLPVVLVYPDVGPGYAKLTAGSGTTPQPGPGSLAVLTFKGLKQGSARIILEASSQAAAQGHTGNVLPEFAPATVTIR
jgi:hypothetical protein